MLSLRSLLKSHSTKSAGTPSTTTAQSERSNPPASNPASSNVYPASDGRFHDLPTSQPQEAHSYAPKSRDLKPVSRTRATWRLFKLKMTINKAEKTIGKRV
ncbi:hypothetical protein LTR65_005965 [Meristemomyces frigidus]